MASTSTTIEKNADKIQRICNTYHNIIIDEMLSYYVSFKLADALIAGPVMGSPMVNFLYTGKPICFYDHAKQQPILDYKEEAWYKSMYVVSETDEVKEFIRMLDRGENISSEESKFYRELIMKEFDGKVCQRIYDYFER